MNIPSRLDTLKEQQSIIRHLLMRAVRCNDALAQARLGTKLQRLNKEIIEVQNSDDRSAMYSIKPRKERAEKQEIHVGQ